ncbi:hypothetical protein [Edaphobacter albus]|uniref:hypothetical protein n=1 Tax=Edaphobacter sp. 4G125 TaxID=2763071 RepID=UPI001647AB2D|nr:hypothetical protein [Edaphobacter sp. 4G125]QNI36155.1 hypothetical protein H7846_14340 [Edaphobacter sp. 4G125]
MMLTRLGLISSFSLLLIAGASCPAQTAEPPQQTEGPTTSAPAPLKTLTNSSIIRMASAGLSDDLILQAISAQPGQYTTDADALVDLKDSGVSERVITAMINKGRKRIAPEGTSTTSDPPPAPVSEVNDIGAYYKDRNGTWQPLQTEVVHIKSGGWLKSTATHGIIKQDRNGHLNGRESKLALQAPVEILVYAAPSVDIAEYDFIRFRINSDNREFRALTGGVFHSTGGAQRDEVPFHPERVAPRTWRFTVDHSVGGGEFGILPPGTGNVTNGGKIYTFAITE